MKFSNTISSEKDSRSMRIICQSFSIFMIVILFSMAKELIVNVVSDGDVYEVKYEKEDTLENGQMVYRLYKNGEYMKDVNYNKYYLLDNDGNTDFKYCTIIDAAGELAYVIILCVMFFLVILIVMSTKANTPFIRENVRRIRAISLLQLTLAFVPGLVRMILTITRFNYVSGTFSFGDVYMIVIAFAIAMIAQVFDYGVRLQEDSDSIA